MKVGSAVVKLVSYPSLQNLCLAQWKETSVKTIVGYGGKKTAVMAEIRSITNDKMWR